MYSLKRYEWEALSELLQQGYPFQHAYRMIQGNELLLQKLEQGEMLSKLLIQGHHGMFYDHLYFFLEITSLQDAITSALAMVDFIKTMRQTLIKQVSYPLVLFLFSFATLFLFSTSIIPSLMQNFAFDNDIHQLSLLVSWMEGFAYLFLYAILIAILLMLFAQRIPKLRYRLLLMLRFTHLPQQYCSYMLAGYYAQMIHHGIATRQMVSFLSRLKQDHLLSICAKQLDRLLAQGVDMKDALQQLLWVDAAFIQSWQIGLHSQQMEQALKQYQKRQEAKWTHVLKRGSVIIQTCAYVFVAFMVLLVYQIMLIPLSILETM